MSNKPNFGPATRQLINGLGKKEPEIEYDPETGEVMSVPDPERMAIMDERRAEREEAKALRDQEEADRKAEETAAKIATKVSMAEVPNVFKRDKNTVLPPILQAPPKDAKKGEVVKLRTDTWKGYIFRDVNPFLTKVTTNFIGVPDERWLDNVIFEGLTPDGKVIRLWDPSLRSRLELSERKAEILAKALAELSVSPLGVALVTWIETHQFIISVGMALGVGVQYGWTLMQTRAEVQQVLQVMKQQAEIQAQHAQGAEQHMKGNSQPNLTAEAAQDFMAHIHQQVQDIPSPGFGESVKEYEARTRN